MENNNQLNLLSTEDKGITKVGKKIKELDNNDLFSFIVSHFVLFFLDLKELRKFISFLYDQKGEMFVEEISKDFNVLMKEFRQQ